ncbi:SEC-C metal-binding domain-containing protein [Syntrophomonas wolfei]|uniref:SEC-C metal-binding domain-containing protein n=1 Tax=Syntrophomonas wolfei TaxID=863 RepID=UPI0007745673|nr:SEC-C metal-binding domain-containing protein [Syntrophomonas wolfei]
MAKQQNDEVFANSQYVVRKYFLLFCNLCMYFELLKEKRYKSSWDKLQDCIDLAKMVGSYIEIENRLEISKVLHLLSSYETLYPYSVFASSEYIISKSHCSICGQSMLSLSCQHIKGKLYWGEVAVEMIDEIKTFQAVALVSHPEDKRCVIELSDDNRTEVKKFKRIDQFLELNQPFLQDFSIKKIIENRMRDDIKIVGRNDPCSCGTGVKFKKCCGKDLYYKHERNIITPLQTVSMIKL